MDKDNKKILIFSTAYFPFVGGAEVAVKEITDRINNIQFDLITARMDRKLSESEKVGNISVYRVGFGWGALDKFLLPFFGFLKARKLYKKNNYDIAWSIMASQASIAAAFLKMLNKRIKLLLTLQEGDEEEHLKRYALGSEFLYKILIRPWHLLIFRKADHVTAISKDLKKRAKKSRVKCRIDIVPNGVDIKKFLIADRQPACRTGRFSIDGFRNKLGIKEDEKVVITISRLVKKNGIEDLIKAVEILVNRFNQKAKLLICGSGEKEDKLKELAKKLRIKDKILFLGHIDHNDLPEYLWISNVFCRPSLSEGLGNVFLEAMAAGVPIIGTPVGGIPDFLKDHETGWFCGVNNPKSIAEKIQHILDEKNKEEVAKVKKNALKMVQEKYDWDKIARDMENVFQH